MAVKMKHANVTDVLEIVDCVDTADLLGLQSINKYGKISIECPWHMKNLGRADHNIGNCKISDDRRFCMCYACGGKGNPIAMVMGYLNLDFCSSVDYIASNLAPYLLSDNLFENKKPVRKCPFTDEDFKVIGLRNDDFFVPVRASFSKYDAKREIEESDNKKLYVQISDRNDAMICTKVRDSLKDIYFDDPEMFFSIVIPKAEEAKERYEKALETEKKRMCNPTFRECMIKELRNRIWICDDFISEKD